MRLSKEKANNSGQMLLGILISLAVFAILIHALFTLVRLSYQFTNFSRARITARHLAQEKIELIRNLPFSEIGTSGGIPSGSLVQQENIQRNGLNYLVKTSIVYIDDPFDNSAPVDLLPTDYKSVRIDVSWEGLAPSRKNPVILVTNVTPEGVETTEGGGTLSIFVFDADAQPISQAEVKVVASSVSPPVDLSLQTADNGRVILPGAPICTDCYEITVTKSGYSSERTYSTAEVANPGNPHQTILEGDLTEISFAIDKVSVIDISSVNNRESDFTPFASVSFQMRGTKTLGTNTEGDPVYKFDQTLTTDVSGQLTLSDVEWGNYN
ncbi:carboxypeptidase-like regulatory domain-containing protein, partial [Patescibacteria group bacterium]|nr:carboxypeptidase-like regulatory domain-containing protein [Patescibacteria group bacterium]